MSPDARGPQIGRVIFTRNKEAVRVKLLEGWSISAIYSDLGPTLAGISFRQFSRYAAAMRDELSSRVVADAPAPVASAPAPPRVPVDPAPPPSAQPAPGNTTSHVSDRRRPFSHDPQPREDDKQRLWGPAPRKEP